MFVRQRRGHGLQDDGETHAPGGFAHVVFSASFASGQRNVRRGQPLHGIPLVPNAPPCMELDRSRQYRFTGRSRRGRGSFAEPCSGQAVAAAQVLCVMRHVFRHQRDEGRRRPGLPGGRDPGTGDRASLRSEVRPVRVHQRDVEIIRQQRAETVGQCRLVLECKTDLPRIGRVVIQRIRHMGKFGQLRTQSERHLSGELGQFQGAVRRRIGIQRACRAAARGDDHPPTR